MKVVNLSQEQIDERYENLPKTIKETFWAASTAQRIWRLGQFYHLSDEKISLLSQIVGQVLIGFILPEDVASEIQETIGIDTRIAQAINNEVRQRIFSPLHEELSKIYNPILGSPKREPVPSKKIEPEPAKLPSGAPLRPIEIESSKPAELSSMADTKTKLPDFEPVMPSESTSTDKPFMIHQEIEPKPIMEKNKTSLPTGWFKKTMPINRQEKPKMPESLIKVQLETFGQKIEKKKEPITAKTEVPKQKIIHYREVEAPTPFGKAQDKLSVKPFDIAKNKSFGAVQDKKPQSEPFGKTQGESFDKIQAKPFEKSSSFIQSKPANDAAQNEPINNTRNKPFNIIQNQPETQPVISTKIKKEVSIISEHPIRIEDITKESSKETGQQPPKPIIPTPTAKTEVESEPIFFAKPETKTPIKIQPQKIETSVTKTEPPKLTPIKTEQASKPTGPKIIDLDSFGATKE